MAATLCLPSGRYRKNVPTGNGRLSSHLVVLLYPVSSASAVVVCNRICPPTRCCIKGGYSDWYQPQQRGSLDRTPLLQSRRTSGCSARWFLDQRAKLGIPHIQLGCHGKRRIPLVDEAFSENGGILRCLPDRSYPRFLPYLGNTDARCTRIVRSVRSFPPYEPGRNRKLWSNVPRWISATIHPWIFPRTVVRTAYPFSQTGLSSIGWWLRTLSDETGIRNTTGGRTILCR